MTTTPSRPRGLLLFLLSLLLLGACSREDSVSPAADDSDGVLLDISDWSEATHGDGVAPDYDAVFAEGTVKSLNIVIAAADWQAMLDDMTAAYGALGMGGRPAPGLGDENPIWVPCSLFYEGTQWYKVGIRFKGNSSLQSAWGRGVLKLPFKLDFDEYEDTYPQLENQRFHGFKQLSLSSGYDDKSLIREKVAADIFRDAGVPSARTTFTRVSIDHGDGPVYFGLYTLVEVVDDTMVDDQFASHGGNLYKPEGTGAAFAAGTFDESSFAKKSNEDAGDWSDILALFDALHEAARTSDPAAWRTRLEQVLDVDGFLRWLAVNTVIQNWDTYGVMTHNFYLYNDPGTGRLSWIPWDNNESLQEGKMGGALPLDFQTTDSRWPLIRFLYDDEDYRARYREEVRSVVADVFQPSRMSQIYAACATLIEPYVIGVDGEQDGYTFLESPGDFPAAIAQLDQHVDERNTAVESFLSRQQ